MVLSDGVLSALIGAVIVVCINAIGWILTYGRLSQRVDDLNKTVNNGLCHKVEETRTSVAQLRGNVETYMSLEQENKKLLVGRLEALERHAHG